MTVRELIAHLSALPAEAQELTCIFRRYSEFETLEADDVRLVTAGQQELILRNGRYMWSDARWHKPGDAPQWASAVAFPGN